MIQCQECQFWYPLTSEYKTMHGIMDKAALGHCHKCPPRPTVSMHENQALFIARPITDKLDGCAEGCPQIQPSGVYDH